MLSILFLLPILTGSEACLAMKVTDPGIPVPKCKTCASKLIHVSTDQNVVSKPMKGDSIVMTGDCAVRTFTCEGPHATIAMLSDPQGTSGELFEDGGSGTATSSVTCNEDGTKWVTKKGDVVTIAQCYTPCRGCGPLPLIYFRNKPDEVISVTNGAVTTTTCGFTCSGSAVEILVYQGDKILLETVPEEVAGTAMIELNCNAAGTGWEFPGKEGVDVTSLDCASK